MDSEQWKSLCEALSQAPTRFEEYEVDKVENQHILNNILPSKKAKLPMLIISQPHLESSTPVRDKEDIENSSIEGSPLKLHEFKEDVIPGFVNTCSSKSYRALPQCEARKLISQYVLGIQNGECGDTPLPLWVLCKQEADDSLVVLGVDVHMENGCQATSTYTVTVDGPFEKTSKLPRMLDLVKRHSSENGGVVETKCFASYNVFGSHTKNISLLSGQGSLVINLEWDNANSLLQTPALDAKPTVLACVSAGDLRSAANFIYSELIILQSFTRGLKEGVVEWAQAAADDIPVLTQVKMLVEELSLGNPVKRGASDSDDRQQSDDIAASPLKHLFLIERTNLDFTEKLWNILKHCSCYQDLINSLQYIFSILQNGKLQPMVHKSNHSQFAELVRDSYYGKMSMPTLETFLPLELLAEIGIGKLCRDYMGIFIGKDLVTAAHLDYFTTGSSLDMSEKCTRLEKLHYALELVVVLEQFLSLPRLTLSITARHALQHYQKHDVDPDHQFVIPVSMPSISERIQGMQPSVWRVAMTSKGVSCVCVLSGRCPLPHVDMVGRVGEEEEEDDGVRFYLTTLRENMLVC